MGSRGSDGPDEILRQNQQILNDLHRGRLLLNHLLCVSVCFDCFSDQSIALVWLLPLTV